MISKRFFSRAAVGTAMLLAAVAFPTPASADHVIIGWMFQNLNGTFTSTEYIGGATTAGDYNLSAQLSTWGGVERFIDPTGLAFFAPGTFGSTSAAVEINMSLFNITGGPGGEADVTGSFVLTDFDGSTIVGDINGTWFRDDAAGAAFVGILSEIFLSATDDSFDGVSSPGTEGAGFSTIFDPVQPFTGTGDMVADVTWFSEVGDGLGIDADVINLGAGVIPAPGAVLLGAIGLAGVGWLRRRLA